MLYHYLLYFLAFLIAFSPFLAGAFCLTVIAVKQRLLKKYYENSAEKIKAKINSKHEGGRFTSDYVYVEFTTEAGNENLVMIISRRSVLKNYKVGDEIEIYCVEEYYDNHYRIKLLPVNFPWEDLPSLSAFSDYAEKIKTYRKYKREMTELLQLRKWHVTLFFEPVCIAEEIDKVFRIK